MARPRLSSDCRKGRTPIQESGQSSANRFAEFLDRKQATLDLRVVAGIPVTNSLLESVEPRLFVVEQFAALVTFVRGESADEASVSVCRP
jgi:hypothetical protein